MFSIFQLVPANALHWRVFSLESNVLSGSWRHSVPYQPSRPIPACRGLPVASAAKDQDRRLLYAFSASTRPSPSQLIVRVATSILVAFGPDLEGIHLIFCCAVSIAVSNASCSVECLSSFNSFTAYVVRAGIGCPGCCSWRHTEFCRLCWIPALIRCRCLAVVALKSHQFFKSSPDIMHALSRLSGARNAVKNTTGTNARSQSTVPAAAGVERVNPLGFALSPIKRQFDRSVAG